MKTLLANSSARWQSLAAGVGLAPTAPVLLALSGGADSVLLLHILAESEPRPPIFAFHLNHDLRGAESRADAQFCSALCERLAIPLTVVRAKLGQHSTGIEAHARRARYRALAREAERLRIEHILTAHHADDRVETLLQRWARGDVLFGLTGPHARLALVPRSELNASSHHCTVLRPLLDLERRAIRAHLRTSGHTWREDSSNQSPTYTRNRIRTQVLPALIENGGAQSLTGLRQFERAVRELDEALAEKSSHLNWTLDRAAQASQAVRQLIRLDLVRLARPVQRRALWNLLQQATGRGPGGRLLEQLLDDLEAGRKARHQLPGAWSLQLSTEELVLTAPRSSRAPSGLDFTGKLSISSELTLADGRILRAQALASETSPILKRPATEVELDALGLEQNLTVRFALPGDRFHALGAPGRRRLCRFLADAKIPSAERKAVPLVFSGTELIWVAGVRPSHARRVRASTTSRLLLSLSAPRIR